MLKERVHHVFNHPDKRQGILGSGVTLAELMEDLHPFMYSPGMIERAKRDIIDPIFKKNLNGMNLMNIINN